MAAAGSAAFSAFGSAFGSLFGAAGAGFPDGFAAVSPAAPSTAITAPTGALSPSATLSSVTTPSSNDSISMFALSVSTSARRSPDFTTSPGCFSHLRILPSSIVSESFGMRTSVAMRFLSVR